MANKILELIESLNSDITLLEKQIEDYKSIKNFIEAMISQVKLTETYKFRAKLRKLIK